MLLHAYVLMRARCMNWLVEGSEWNACFLEYSEIVCCVKSDHVEWVHVEKWYMWRKYSIELYLP